MSPRLKDLATNAAALVAALGIAAAALLWLDLRREARPIEDWFEVPMIRVPIHVLGDDAKVVFTRVIKRPFTANWTVKIESAADGQRLLCMAFGNNDYAPGDSLPADGVAMSEIFGNHPCKWREGEFVLKTSWEIHREGYDIKVVRQTSNPFRVLPAGSQLYLTPEQVQKLEEE